MIILLDGPEKAGKTTLRTRFVEEAEKYKWHVIQAHMKRPTPVDHNAYLPLLLLGCRTDSLVIFDRSWVSEVVYNQLLKRTETDLTIAQVNTFHYIVDTAGISFILTDDPENLESLRSADDLSVSVPFEVAAYNRYARGHFIGIITKEMTSQAFIQDTFQYLEDCRRRMERDPGTMDSLRRMLAYMYNI